MNYFLRGFLIFYSFNFGHSISDKQEKANDYKISGLVDRFFFRMKRSSAPGAHYSFANNNCNFTSVFAQPCDLCD